MSANRTRTDLELEVIAAAVAYVKWDDDARDLNNAFDADRSAESLRRVQESDAAYDGVHDRLSEAVYALEDHHD